VEAAEKMDVSRPTFTRIYDKALKKIARAFVEHREIIIKGGQVTFDEDWFRCNSCHYIFKMPGKGNNISHCPVCGSQDIIDETAGNRRAEKGSETWCVCVECRNKVKHEPGIPCRKMECPECNGRMKRLNG
jgi:predicted Zn-ribbon and HTH transcriptional regulator